MDVVFLLIGATLGWLLAHALRSSATVPSAPATAAAVPAVVPAPADALAPAPESKAVSAVSDAASTASDPRARASELAKALADFCDHADQGADLEREPRFVELCALLSAAPFTAQDRLNWVTSQTTALSSAALAAMASAGDDNRRGVARVLGRLGYLALHFAFRHLAEGRDPGVCGIVLLRAPRWWTEHPPTRAGFVALLDRQRSLGIKPAIGDDKGAGDWDLEDCSDILGAIAHPLLDDFLVELKQVDRARRGTREIARVGRLLGADDQLPLARNEATREGIDALVQSLLRVERPSLVLVGPDGVGKTTLARAALRELVRQGWRVVEATPSQMMAGQKYIGELEQRVENFVDGLGGGRAVWFVPECHQLLEQGSWSGNPHGMLDLLLPYLERGALQLLGESTLAAWTRVITQRPRVEALITGLRVEPMSDADTLALVRDWGVRSGAQD